MVDKDDLGTIVGVIAGGALAAAGGLNTNKEALNA